jgi:hypothetical protein
MQVAIFIFGYLTKNSSELLFMNEMSLAECLGWIGVVFYVSSYLLLSTGKLRANSYLFHLLNILGALGLITDSVYENDKPNLAVNSIWFLIGIWAIGKRFYLESNRRNRL